MATDAEAPLIREGNDGEQQPRVRDGIGSKWLAGILFAALLLVGAHDLLRDNESAPQEMVSGKARQLEKLKKPLVILISLDGFRWGYTDKVPTPNIDSLAAEGTSAAKGLIPVYPSATFPNHYSIVTGLYPAWHGIIQNQFSDPDSGKIFGRGDNSPEWWLGEPLWVTVTKQGLKAAASFWPGSEVELPPWKCSSPLCVAFSTQFTDESRVDKVLEWVDLPLEERPSLVALYLGSPDAEGHNSGPDSPEVTAAVSRVDGLLGRLISGLKARKIYNDVSVILLGDHGMVQTCESKHVFLEDFAPWINISKSWVDYAGSQVSIRPAADVSTQEVYDKLVEALKSGKIKNAEHIQFYLRENLPKRLHYNTGRVQPIIGLVDESYNVAFTRADIWCGGVHGYDNAYQSMRSIFIARGPKFAKGKLVPSFENVQVYNIISEVLQLQNPAPNNGTLAFSSSILLPSES